MGSRGTQTDHPREDLLVLKYLSLALISESVAFVLRFQVINNNLVEIVTGFSNSKVSCQLSGIDHSWTPQKYVTNAAHRLLKKFIKWIQLCVCCAVEYMCHIIIHLGYPAYSKLNLIFHREILMLLIVIFRTWHYHKCHTDISNFLSSAFK